MKTHINSRAAVFADNNVGVYVDFQTIESKFSIAAIKWEEILETQKSNQKGKCLISKAYKDKPAKTLQWTKDDSTITFEVFHSNSQNGWDFQNEYVLTLEDIEAFTPIYEYSMNIVQNLKKEFSDEALSDTGFLTR